MAESKQVKRLRAAVRPGRPEKYTAETVLNTALNLYWTEGVSGLSVNDLVRRMGIPKPSLYRHFPSEDKLQASVLLAYEATALSRLRAVSTQPGPFARQMDDYLEILINGIAGHAQGCLLFQMRENKDRLGPRARAICDEVFARYFSDVHSWLAAAAARREISLSAEPVVATHLVIGLITLMRNAFRDGLDEAGVRALAAAHLRGIYTPSDPAVTV